MIKNKTILLTGATGGIGREIAGLLAKQKVRLILVDIQQQSLKSLALSLDTEPSEICAIAADLSTPEGLHHIEMSLREKYQSLDVLINCAGINVFSMFDDVDEKHIEKMIAVNISSLILLTKRMLPLLKKSSHGLIINFGSTLGSIGHPGFSIYCATKFAICGFTEALRRELANSNISVSYIAPRATRTGINTEPVNKMNEALGVKMDMPQVVARNVLEIIRHGKSSARYIGWPEKLFVRLNNLLPSLVDNALIKQLDTITHFAKLNNH